MVVAMNDHGARRTTAQFSNVAMKNFPGLEGKVRRCSPCAVVTGNAAQDRGEVAKLGTNQSELGVPEQNTRPATAAAYRAEADAHEIQALAKRRLADEYDAAQERGEVAASGDTLRQGPGVPEQNAGKATAADIGLSRKEIHEARLIRDAEAVIAALERLAPHLDRKQMRRIRQIVKAGGRTPVDDDNTLTAMHELLSRGRANSSTDAMRQVLSLSPIPEHRRLSEEKRILRKYKSRFAAT